MRGVAVIFLKIHPGVMVLTKVKMMWRPSFFISPKNHVSVFALAGKRITVLFVTTHKAVVSHDPSKMV